jgi:hypothetical protein
MKMRVLPLVITGTALLLVLKATGIVVEGHYAFAQVAEAPKAALAATYRPSASARSVGQSVPANKAALLDADPIITGSVPKAKAKAKSSMRARRSSICARAC